MPPMPYVVTQGDINTALENAYNFGTPAQDGNPPLPERTAVQVRLETLRDLAAGVPIGRCGRILDRAIADHIDIHWFGIDPETRNPVPTWWVNWEGPAEAVARKGMIAGLAISLGLPADDNSAIANAIDSGGEGLRLDWVDFSWICPVPRFEIWVSWRECGPDGRRAVNVTMATPGPGNYEPQPSARPILDRPGGELRSELPYDYGQSTPADNGHIVVGSGSATTTALEFDLALRVDPPGLKWNVTLASTTVSTDAVVVHKPERADGITDEAQPDDDATYKTPQEVPPE